MKTLPAYPYIWNIADEYRRQHNLPSTCRLGTEHYRTWLRQFGFKVPTEVLGQLDFPDDFSDEDLVMFMLKYGCK